MGGGIESWESGQELLIIQARESLLDRGQGSGSETLFMELSLIRKQPQTFFFFLFFFHVYLIPYLSSNGAFSPGVIVVHSD